MTTTQFNTLVQMIAALSARIEEVAKRQDQFATKKDLEAFATKQDLERFATKEDLSQYATKKDLEQFATKKDLEEMANTILEALQASFAQHERILKNHNLHV